jgi:type VI secretion system protein ImpH
MHINFMGLFGPNGPLPLHLTEYARERERHFADPTFRRFCDIFHHRMIALFYRAWAVNQPTVSFDRYARDAAADTFGFFLASVIGLGGDNHRNRDALPDIAKLHFAGRLAHQTRPPEGLAAAIGAYFGVPCDLDEFRGRWIDLPKANHMRLGESPSTGALGQTSIVGSRLCKYMRFLPGTRTFARVVAWARNYVGYQFDWDIQIILRKEEVPGTRLGTPLGGTPPALLGWTTWTKSGPAKPMDRDRGDLVLRAPTEAQSGVL